MQTGSENYTKELVDTEASPETEVSESSNKAAVGGLSPYADSSRGTARKGQRGKLADKSRPELPVLNKAMKTPMFECGYDKSMQTSKSLKAFQKELALATYNLELARRRLNKLDANIKEVNSGRRAMMNAASKRRGAPSLRVGRLQDNLDTASQRLNVMNKANDKLRNGIVNARIKRKSMIGSLRKLKAELARSRATLGKATMGAVDDDRESRMKQHSTRLLKNELEAEKDEAYKMVGTFETSRQQLEHHRSKGKTGCNSTSKSTGNRHGSILAEGEANYSETVLQCHIVKLALLNAIQRKHIQEHEARQEYILEAFRVMEESANLSSIEEIIRELVKSDRLCYSMSHYKADLDNQTDDLIDRNKMLVEFLQWHQRQEQEAEINSTQPRTPALALLSSEITKCKSTITDGNIKSQVIIDLLENRIEPKANEVLEKLGEFLRQISFEWEPFPGLLSIVDVLDRITKIFLLFPEYLPDDCPFKRPMLATEEADDEEVPEDEGEGYSRSPSTALDEEPNKRADLERQSSKDSVVSRQEPKKKKRGRIIRIPTQLLPSAESDDHDSLVTQETPLTCEEVRRHLMEISSARRHKFGAKGWSFDDIQEDDDAEEEKATTEAKAASERESAAEAEEPSPEEGPPAEPTSSREGEDTARVKRSYTHGGDIDRAADPQDFPERPDSRHGGSRSLRSIRTFAGEPQQATDQTPLKVEVPEVSHSPDAAADEQSVDTAGEERAPAGPVAASEAEELQQFMADELSPAESFTDTFEEDQPDSPLSESMPSVDDGMVEEEAPTGALAAPQTEDPELMTDQLMSEEPSLAEPLTETLDEIQPDSPSADSVPSVDDGGEEHT